MPTGRRPTPATPRSRTAPSTCTKRPTRDTSRVGTGRESGTLGDPRAPHVAAGESRRDRAMRAGRVPRMPRWLRQPRHAGRAWYYPFTLASGSDPRHGSRVGLLARVKPALGLRGIVENERRYAWLIALAVLTGVLGAVGNVVFRDAILGATWLFQGRVAPLGRIGIPLALIGGGLVLLALDRLFPGGGLGYGVP